MFLDAHFHAKITISWCKDYLIEIWNPMFLASQFIPMNFLDVMQKLWISWWIELSWASKMLVTLRLASLLGSWLQIAAIQLTDGIRQALHLGYGLYKHIYKVIYSCVIQITIYKLCITVLASLIPWTPIITRHKTVVIA